jgi:hypothetical protein
LLKRPLIFLLWFASGIVMMCWNSPEVSTDDRLQRLPTLASERILVGGAGLFDFEEKEPREPLDSVRTFGVKELEFTSFTGQPLYLATDDNGEARIIPVRGPPRPSFDVDACYLDRRQAPLPVIYAALNDPIRTRYYIDSKTLTSSIAAMVRARLCVPNEDLAIEA